MANGDDRALHSAKGPADGRPPRRSKTSILFAAKGRRPPRRRKHAAPPPARQSGSPFTPKVAGSGTWLKAMATWRKAAKEAARSGGQ